MLLAMVLEMSLLIGAQRFGSHEQRSVPAPSL